MLVLSRRVNDRIVLPDLGITVVVLDVKGGRARLGIEAPPEVAVVREELLREPPAARCFSVLGPPL
jgi:carbon storage regulator